MTKEFLRSDELANYLIAAEHAATCFVITWGILWLYRKAGRRSPWQVLLSFAIFWASGALMHAGMAADVFGSVGKIIWFRVLVTPFSCLGWLLVIRWMGAWIDLMQGRLSVAESNRAAAHKAGFEAGVKAECERLLGPTSGKTTSEDLEKARAKLRKSIDEGK